MATLRCKVLRKPLLLTGKKCSETHFRSRPENRRPGDFYLTLKKDKKLGKEGYAIAVAKYVTVSAPETTGVYWATRTLLQIGEQSDNHALPHGTVRDWPDYSVRGIYDGLRTQVHSDGLHARSGEDDVLLQDECTAGTFER